MERRHSRRLDRELRFAFLVRQLSDAQKLAVLMRIWNVRSEPPPVREWWVVNPTGGKQRL